MRPIELTIKGINSYSEEQTIDFRELTKEGIFGIFGPTGSGKSTILDGITLALYGELARKSKNFIHVGSDSASVSFTFSITEKETKVYRVFRTFKVKKENGYSVAAKARLCELVTGVEDGEQDAQDETEDVCREVVLEDSISGVKDRIQKIVGLEFDDFTRTVVLPQGKFSEFLKLSGSDRNQMLERLFHLYDYGMALIDKVKRKTEQNDLLYRVCIGKLAEHAGENEEAYQSMRETLLRIKKEQEENQKKQQLFLRDFEKNKALWELQKELDEKLEEYRILEQEKADAKETKLRLEAAERAAIVRPFWEQKKRAQTEFQKTNEYCIRYAGELEQEREKLKELEQSVAAVTEQKSAVENGYQEKLRKLERACELEQQHKEQSKRLETLRIELEKQLKTGEIIDRDAQEQEIFLQEQKALLAETEQAYYAHMEETVRMHLHEQMEQEGVCPICGNVYHGEKSGEEDGVRALTEESGACVGKNPASAEQIPEEAGDADVAYKELELLREEIVKLESTFSKVRQSQLEVRTDIAAKQGTFHSLEQTCEEQKNELCKLMAECGIKENPQRYKQELVADYQNVCVLYEKSRRELETKKAQLTELEIRNARELARKEEQEKALRDAKEVLDRKMAEQKFDDQEQIEQSIWEPEQIERTRAQLQSCEERYGRVLHEVELLKAKTGDQRLDERAYEEMLRTKDELEEKLTSGAEQIAVYTERLKQLQESLVIVKQLEEEKKALEHKKAILSELMTLFKGKKFVEYVARERLNYVAGEASETLLEITGGVFGLELRESGEFVIRDYKNGGIARNVNSLSGGELFLVSLSLALALSTQIQLKGTAPLEFFFLDEGFGTLDDNLLDTVMDSLDTLHHDRRKIGIISHVDAIKERVPVKLIVTPAKAGEGGSRIEIMR